MSLLNVLACLRKRSLSLASLATFALAGFVFSAALQAATLEEIKKRGYMVVVTEDDFRPFEFVKDGKPTGFDNEMLDELRKFVPFEIRQEIIPWTGLLAGVSTGKYDVAVTAAIITKERVKSLDFAMPIADATHYFVKRKGDDSIKSIADLSGKALGIQAGSALLGRLPELTAKIEATGGKLGKVVQYTSYPEAYQDLALKRTDYVINTIINIKTLVAEKPKVFEVGLPVSGEVLSVMVRGQGQYRAARPYQRVHGGKAQGRHGRQAPGEMVRPVLAQSADLVHAGILSGRTC